MTSTVKQQLIEFFQQHPDDIKYAKKGYIPRLMKMFNDESNCEVPITKFRNILYYYRTKYDCPLQYVENKYYQPSKNPDRLTHYTTNLQIS